MVQWWRTANLLDVFTGYYAIHEQLMAGYRATQIRKPENETEFEQNCNVLFKGILKDPNVKRLGKRGQKQFGIDSVGHRDRNPMQVVGVQCKLKTGRQKLSKREILTEVNKALKYKPLLTEYFIVTTAENDRALDQYAQVLTQRQAARRRTIHIEVWCWGTLCEAINNDEDAKKAFDPGFSPSVESQTRAIEALAVGQENLATRGQLDNLAANVARLSSTENVKYPAAPAQRELAEQLSLILQRRGFASTNCPQELAELADRALGGELSLASLATRFEVLDRAARANAAPETIGAAEKYLAGAGTLNPSGDLSIAQAVMTGAKGDTEAAMQALRNRKDADARAAMFNLLLRARGAEGALGWVREQSLKATDFNPAGVINLVIKEMEQGGFDTALAYVTSVPESYLAQCPALYLLRAQLTLASILPVDQRAALFQGLPIDPSNLQLASGTQSQDILRAASADMKTLLGLLPGLQLTQLQDFLLEFELWLQLELHETKSAALKQLAEEISDPAKTLRRVRLALAYGVTFNGEALERNLLAQKELGGWTPDQRFAAFLLAYHAGDPAKLAAFFEQNHEELFAQTELVRPALAGFEIESLARSGRLKEARAHLALHTGEHLLPEQANALDQLLTGIESGDEVELLRKRYAESGELGDLRMLVVTLRAKRDHVQLASYAPALARATRTQENFDLALTTLYQSRRYSEVVEIAEEFPNLYALSDEFASLKGWALLQLGRIQDARAIARDLWTRRGSANDRELAINTAVESGDWGYLQGILSREAGRADNLSAAELMRLARLAVEMSSSYVDRFRDVALKQAPDDPQINLSAYILAVERGEEYHGSQAHAWFQKALATSGTDGPIKQMSMKDIVDQAQGWQKHVEHVDEMLRQAQAPLFVAAKALRRQLLDMSLGQAMRNAHHKDARAHYPIFAFFGKRAPLDTVGVHSPAFDLTTLITLDHLGLLETALGHFERVVIGPRTLATLFGERQLLRMHQPSQRAKAQRLQSLISSGHLKTLPPPSGSIGQLAKEVGRELATLLETAQRDGGLVVRSAPVFKLGSFLEESVDLSEFAKNLTDTRAVLSFLANAGKITGTVAASAEAYLSVVDQGWPSAPPIDADSTLYLDDLSVTYLDYVGLLEPLTQNVKAVFVESDVGEQVRGTLSYADFSADLIAAIERLRAALSAGIDDGRIVFSARRLADDADADEDVLDHYPTIDLLVDLSSTDLVFSDDRCLNREAFWADANQRRVANGSTLDLLLGLKQAGTLEIAAYWEARNKLRAGGYYAVQLEPEEVTYHLGRATVVDGVLRETPELKAIRESIALPRLVRSFVPGEEYWLANMRHAVFRAMRDIWTDEPNPSLSEAQADWLLSVLPDPMAWCADPDDEALWAAARQQTAFQIGLLMVFVGGDAARREKYFAWLDNRLLTPLRRNHPEIWDAALEFVKSYVPQLMELEYEQEG
jgi:hypothetical protein